jgi:hypothetical protein
MRAQTLTTIALAALLATPLPAPSQTSRLEGTWKLNLAKSKYSPGPPPKALTLKWEPAAGGLKLIVDGVDGEGETVHTETLERSDGSEAPVEGLETQTLRALKRINDRTYEEVDRNNSRVMTTRRYSISRDGKTLTVNVKGVNLQGRPVLNVVVFERQ